MVEVLSKYIIFDPCRFFLSPYKTLLNHTSRHVVDVTATYSTSADESVIIGFFLDAHEITFEQRGNT